MTHNNNHTNIEELPPGDFDNDTRKQITGYQPQEPIDTGASIIESQTVKNIVAQREDNPYLRLTVLMGVTGIVGLFLWLIFALISPKAPEQIAEEPETEEPAEIVELEPDYQAKLALTDQFYSLEKKPEPQIEVKANSELPLVDRAPVPAPTPISTPRPIPRPAAPRPAPRPTYRPAPKPVTRPITQPVQVATYAERYPLGEPEIPPQEQWLALANFGTGVSSRSIPQRRTQVRRTPSPSQTNSTPTPALLVNNPLSQGELGILNRRSNTNVLESTPAIAIDRGITKGKIELPLVWDSSLKPEQQQFNQITVILEEPIYDTEGKVIFDRGSVAIVEVQSINDTNGLVTAYVSQIDNTTFNPGELILRNKKRSALVAKASKRSNFGNRLLVGGVDTLSSFGQQILIPETNSTVSNGTAIVTSQSRNSIGRDLAGSALDGFGSSLSSELKQRSNRNQIGDAGTIFTLAQNTTVYLTNIKPLKINP